MTLSFYWAFLILLLGFLTGVIGSISYLKGLRGDGKRYPYYELILAGIPFGSLGVLLVLVLAKEIRDEDATHHHLILLSNLILLSLQIVAVFLLCYFKIIVF